MFVAERVTTPVFVTVRAPVPLIKLAMVMAEDRLTAKVALLVMLPVPSWPVIPPAPTAKVPALIVVVPE